MKLAKWFVPPGPRRGFMLRNRFAGAFAAREEAVAGDDALFEVEDVASLTPWPR